MRADTFQLQTQDGTRLHTYRWLPDGTPKAVVQIAHGMSEHAGRYARFAELLTANGYAVYADDHRGHGKSAVNDADTGYAGPDGWNRMVGDLHDLTLHIKKEHPGLKVLVYAHSMGSFLFQQYLFAWSQDVAGIVMSASNGKPPAIAKVGILLARMEALRLGPRGRSKLLDTLSFADFNNHFKPTRTAFDWLSRDPAEVDKYIADNRCGFICTASFWADFLVGLQWIARPENQARIRKDLPIYIVAGALDPVSQATKGLAQLLGAYKAAGLTQVTHRFWPEGRHEMLNETNRDEFMKDVLAWCDRVAGA